MRLVLALLAFSCVGLTAQTVEVINGSGDGRYSPGATIHVWADPDPDGKVFDRWSGDTATLADVRSPHTTLRVTNAEIQLTATYRDMGPFNPRRETIAGVNVVSVFSARPAAVIFRFHPDGADGASQVFSSEAAIFNRQAVARDFAIVALDSADRAAKQWDARNSLDNNDVKNVQAVVAELLRRGTITASTPLFAMGISGGGAFASRVANLLKWRGVAMYISSGIDAIIAESDIPSIWGMQQFDDNTGFGPEGNLRASANFNTLRNKSVACHYYMNQPSPLYAERFWRIDGLAKEDSWAIFRAIQAGGFLDDQGFLKQNPSTSGVERAIPAEYRAQSSEIQLQLRSAFAAHEFFSDFSHRMLDFVAQRVGGAPALTIVNAATFVGGASAPGALVSAFAANIDFTRFLPAGPDASLISVRDSAGNVRNARVLGVAAGQVNFVIPENSAQGAATVIVNGPANLTQALDLKAAAPGLFSATNDGRGRAAAQVLRSGGEVFLVLFATGIRNVTGANRLVVRVNGVDAKVDYSGPQNQFPGLDQLNLRVPASEAAKDAVSVTVLAEGQAATALQVPLR